MGNCTTEAKPFWQAHFSKEKEKAAILASASHTVAERRGIGGYVEASSTTNARPIRWCLRKSSRPQSARGWMRQTRMRRSPTKGYVDRSERAVDHAS